MSEPFTNEKLVKYDFMRETVVYEHKGGKNFISVKLNLDGVINRAFDEGTPFLLKTKMVVNRISSQKCIPFS